MPQGIERNIWLLMGVVVTLVGCASKFGPGQVARDWSCKIREMQIRPIFPPREDIHVGDLFWLQTIGKTDAQGYCENDFAQQKDFLPLPVYLAHAKSVTTLAKQHYEGRPDLPRTATSSGTVTFTANSITISSPGQSTDATIGTDSLFTQGKANRTRLVGFPDFMSVKIDKASLGAIVPIQGVFTPLGFSSEEIDEASISVPVAESYSVPVASAWQAISTSKVGDPVCAAGEFVEHQAKGMASPAGNLHLVTEVFYTRAIDVNIQARASAAFGTSRDRSGGTTVSVPSVTSTGIVTPTGSVGTVGTTTLGDMSAVASGLVQILSSRANVPGVSLSVERGRASTVAMRRVFDRPVAIGYRSIPILVQKGSNGTCTVAIAQDNGGAGPMGAPNAGTGTGAPTPATGGGISTSPPKP